VIVLNNIALFNGHADHFCGDACVAFTDGRIIYAGPREGSPSLDDGAQVIDGHGHFVMPGMVESHAHLSYTNNGPLELDKSPVEEVVIKTIHNARVMLGSGFTSAISFGSVHRVDAFLKRGIECGDVLGPRLLAGGRDIGSTGSNADLHPDYAQLKIDGLGMITDGPWEVRKAVRTLSKNGVDVVKVMIDGELISSGGGIKPGVLGFTDEELAVLVGEAHHRGMRVACHARSAAAVKQAVKAGVDFIGHANYLDDEALALLEASRDRVFVGPAVAWEITFLEHYQSFGFATGSPEHKGYAAELEATQASVKRMREAGIRVLVGGDYGLNITPHGTYAKELQYFTDYFGFSAGEALQAATKHGGEAFMPDGSLGTLEAGKIADMVIVKGNPLEQIGVLQDADAIAAVIKEGQIYTGLLDNQSPHQKNAEQLNQLLGARPCN
jgi:imidazolonepropionase-like amidohydrolase|tara:strand:+ start:673 stop:1992 length:1320 start_codon:yes stop_codon:yes gene_type:complete